MYHVISLNDLPVGDRFTWWRETVFGMHLPIGVRSAHVDDFRVAVNALDLGAVQVCAMACSPILARRTANMIGQGDPECYQLSLGVRGTLTVSQAGWEIVGSPAGMALFDTWRPFHGAAHIDRGMVAVIHARVPRILVPLPPDRVGELTAVRLPACDGVAALLAQFLTRVIQDAAAYRPADAARLGSVLVDLLTAVLAHHLGTTPAGPPESQRRALLLRIHAHIERSLADPRLCPATVAAAHHLSVRSLHRLFEDQGTTVADWIRTRRLEYCRRDLADPHQRHHPIRAIAARWGHPDPANFTRAFRTAYGLTPGEYRTQHDPAHGCISEPG